MTFLLPSPSSDLKVPSVVGGTPRKTIEIQRAETSAEAPKTDGTTAQRLKTLSLWVNSLKYNI